MKIEFVKPEVRAGKEYKGEITRYKLGERRKAFRVFVVLHKEPKVEFMKLETVHLSKGQKLSRLKELSKMYALYASIQATYKESQSLKGLVKMKYDKEHKGSLSKYPELKERMQSLLQNGEKLMTKQ